MALEALIFDVDGTLADTEEAHRQAFNAAFRAHGLDWDWDRALYARLLRVTGGKERIESYIESLQLAPWEQARLKQLVASMHAEKTRVYARLLSEGGVRLRPGIARLIAEARSAGVALAIASTTTPENVETLIGANLGREALDWFDPIATGDVVRRKKPAPDIYELAISLLGVQSRGCVAFEDSEIGVRAAKAAGLFTVATPSNWTAGQDLSAADLVLPSLGDPDESADPLTQQRIGAPYLTLENIERLYAAWST